MFFFFFFFFFFNQLIPVGLISCCIYIPFVFDCRPILVFFEAFFNVFFLYCYCFMYMCYSWIYTSVRGLDPY